MAFDFSDTSETELIVVQPLSPPNLPENAEVSSGEQSNNMDISKVSEGAEDEKNKVPTLLYRNYH